MTNDRLYEVASPLTLNSQGVEIDFLKDFHKNALFYFLFTLFEIT